MNLYVNDYAIQRISIIFSNVFDVIFCSMFTFFGILLFCIGLLLPLSYFQLKQKKIQTLNKLYN